MQLITYLFAGFLATVVGALPLGTSNVAVINTTIKEHFGNARKIIYTAALGEVILAVLAINFRQQAQNFIGMNLWLQWTIIVILFVVGFVLILGRKECIKDENGECIYIKKRSITISKQTLGFILGLINPTVLVYWLFVIAFLNKHMLFVTTASPLALLVNFLVGVYLGKFATLYAFGKFSHLLKQKLKNTTAAINRVVGVLLLVISIVQGSKLLWV